ncbi:MAG TPA: tetratricopeptide repeat protein [Thermoanaerobaculia bacterium]
MSIITVVVLALAMANIATAQVRGRGRLNGTVVDKTTGKGIEGATITIVPATESTAPIVAKTDARGRWQAIGFTTGQWNVDIAANGYETSRGSVSISEAQMIPPIKTELTPVPPAEAPAPVVEAVPKEAVAAIKEGQDLLAIKAGDVVTSSQTTGAGSSTAVSHTVTADEVKENAKHAAADFEKALPLVPDKPEFAQTRTQIAQVMAQAYYRAGDLPKAIQNLELVRAADATNTGVQLLLVNLYLENGQLDKAKELLTGLPANAITEPTPYVNVAILFLNKKDPASAVSYLDKAVALDPKAMESYYYRGLAEMQMKKMKEAKADFEQVLALAPADSPEAHDAKQLLAGLK